MVSVQGLTPDNLPIKSIGAFCHAKAQRPRSLAAILRTAVAETEGSGKVRPNDVWLGDAEATAKPRLNRDWFLPTPAQEHNDRLSSLADAFDNPENDRSVVSCWGWGGTYAKCQDVAAAIRLYLAWCNEGEPGCFETILKTEFPGSSVPTTERNAALKAHLVEQQGSGPV